MKRSKCKVTDTVQYNTNTVSDEQSVKQFQATATADVQNILFVLECMPKDVDACARWKSR